MHTCMCVCACVRASVRACVFMRVYMYQLVYYTIYCIEGIMQSDFDSLNILYRSVKYANAYPVSIIKNTMQLRPFFSELKPIF